MAEERRLSAVGHLTPEVVAALVDGELSRGAEHRARIHLVYCEDCRDEVKVQRQAAERVRDSGSLGEIHVSGSLLQRLTRIPTESAGQDAQADPSPEEDTLGLDGCRRPDSLTGRLAAAARKVHRRAESLGGTKSHRPHSGS